MVISILFNLTFLSLVFSISFFSIRSLCGGYHCNSSVKCYFTTLGIYIIFLAISFLSHQIINTFNFIASIIGILLIFFLAPMASINNKVSLRRLKKCKFYVVSICGVHAALLFIFQTQSVIMLKYPISFSLLVTGIMLLIGKKSTSVVKKQKCQINIFWRNKHEKTDYEENSKNN